MIKKSVFLTLVIIIVLGYAIFSTVIIYGVSQFHISANHGYTEETAFFINKVIRFFLYFCIIICSLIMASNYSNLWTWCFREEKEWPTIRPPGLVIIIISAIVSGFSHRIEPLLMALLTDPITMPLNVWYRVFRLNNPTASPPFPQSNGYPTKNTKQTCQNAKLMQHINGD